MTYLLIHRNFPFLSLILILVISIFIPFGNTKPQSFGLGDSLNRQIYILDDTTRLIVFESTKHSGDEVFEATFGVFNKGSGWELPFDIYWSTPTVDFTASRGNLQSGYLTYNDGVRPIIFEISIENNVEDNYMKLIEVGDVISEYSQFIDVEYPYITSHSSFKDENSKELIVIWSNREINFNSTSPIFITSINETGSIIVEQSIHLIHTRREQYDMIHSSHSNELFIFKTDFSEVAVVELNNDTVQNVVWVNSNFTNVDLNIQSKFDLKMLLISTVLNDSNNNDIILRIIDQSLIFSNQETVAEYTISTDAEFYNLFNSALNQDKKILFKEKIILTDGPIKKGYSVVLIDENEISIFELDQLYNDQIFLSKITTSTRTSLSNLYPDKLMSEVGLSTLSFTESMGQYMFSWTEKFSSEDEDEFYDILNINYKGSWSSINQVTFTDKIYEMNKGTGSFLFLYFISGLVIMVVVKHFKWVST